MSRVLSACRWWLAVAPLVFVLPAAAGDFTAFATAATDYRFRGVSHSDEEAVLAAGANYRFESGWYASAWVSNASYFENANFSDGVDIEAQYWLGWDGAVGADWTLGASVGWYRYPGTWRGWDYDYRELQLSATWRNRYALTTSYSDDTSGYYLRGSASNGHARSISASAGWPLGKRTSTRLHAGAGYYDLEDVYGSDYMFWSLVVSHDWRRINASIGGYGADDNGRRIYGDGVAGATLLLSVTVNLLR